MKNTCEENSQKELISTKQEPQQDHQQEHHQDHQQGTTATQTLENLVEEWQGKLKMSLKAQSQGIETTGANHHHNDN